MGQYQPVYPAFLRLNSVECLRDIGLEDYCRRIGNDLKTMPYTRFAQSMAGKEFARVYAWGSEPVTNVTNANELLLIHIANRDRVDTSKQVPAHR